MRFKKIYFAVGVFALAYTVIYISTDYRKRTIHQVFVSDPEREIFPKQTDVDIIHPKPSIPKKIKQKSKKTQTTNLMKPDDDPSYWIRRETRVTPLDFKFLISSTRCQKGDTHLLIMVISMAGNRRYRDVIRQTWGGVNNNNTWAGTTLLKPVRLVFLFGVTSENDTQILRAEALETNDIVLADFKESYFNLTLKVLMGLKWTKEHCSGANYILKADEDSIVHIPWLLERLESTEWNTKIVGPLFTHQVRYGGGKYYVSEKSYPFQLYPPHVKGNVYVIPRNISRSILEVSEYMPYVNMEDVHITGILAKVVGAKHKRIPSSEYNPSNKPRVCEIALRNKFAGRDVSIEYAKEIWEKVLNPELCKTI